MRSFLFDAHIPSLTLPRGGDKEEREREMKEEMEPGRGMETRMELQTETQTERELEREGDGDGRRQRQRNTAARESSKGGQARTQLTSRQPGVSLCQEKPRRHLSCPSH